MQARRAARELALILFSQMNTIENINNWDYQDIVLKSVRTLTNNSTDELKMATNSILEIKEMIEEYETNHETNLERPIGVSNLPVAIPTTQDMQAKLDEL